MFLDGEFQVFVHDGKVHIIPLPATPGELTIYPTGTPILHQVLKLVFGPHNTEAAAKIQETIQQRIAMWVNRVQYRMLSRNSSNISSLFILFKLCYFDSWVTDVCINIPYLS